MSFTYSDTLATDRDVIRFQIGDTAASPSGVKPNGGNYSDAEIAGVLTVEGNANRAIARLYENLAGLWAKYGLSEIGPRKEDLKAVSASYAKLAKQWRDDYGYAAATVTNGFVTRVDGYSQDIDSGETDTVDSSLLRWWE